MQPKASQRHQDILMPLDIENYFSSLTETVQSNYEVDAIIFMLARQRKSGNLFLLSWFLCVWILIPEPSEALEAGTKIRNLQRHEEQKRVVVGKK